MAEGMAWMSQRDRERMVVLEKVQAGDLTLAEGAERMGLGERQAWRLLRRHRDGGGAALPHRARGRLPGNRAKDASLRERALDLLREGYEGYGPTLAAERLEEDHGVKVDHETLRRWMMKAGLWAPRREGRKHRKRRPRRPCFGELLQIDGSFHAWLAGRKPCCLMVLIDDATGVRMALLSEEETTEAAMTLLKMWIERHGVPGAIYADRKSVYHGEEGRPSAFGLACKKLSIELVRAHSPQAKGRVERANGVFQDRLVKELRRCGIEEIGGANAFLPGFLDGLNAKLAVAPESPQDAHRAADLYDLGAILAWEEERTVANDWTVRYKNRFFQLGDGVRPGSKVVVRRRLDGALQFLAASRQLSPKEIAAPPAPEPHALAPPKPRKPQKPPPSHPWIKGFKARARKAAASIKAKLLAERAPSKMRQAIKPGAPPPDPRSLSPGEPSR